MTIKTKIILTIIPLIFSFLSISAQNYEALLKEAKELHKNYEFDNALKIYNNILSPSNSQTQHSLDSITDKTTLSKLLSYSQNGKNMLSFACNPQIITTQTFPKETFFLNYPGFETGIWIETPEELSGNRDEKNYMFIPNNAMQVFFSAKDSCGLWNIYTSSLTEDGKWTQPTQLNKNITSQGNELFPYLSPDGKSLYFSSDGHYGLGGFDVYVSNWDESTNDWGVAQNLGFPFSSPQDDFLYINTPDNKYTIFASNRDTDSNNIKIYVVEYESSPIKKNIQPEQARELSHLTPNTDRNNNITNNNTHAEYDQYRKATATVRSIQDKIENTIKEIEKNRNLYSTISNQEDRNSLTQKIIQQEAYITNLRLQLDSSTTIMQNIELELISKGIYIPQEETIISPSSKNSTFMFAKNKLAEQPEFIIETTSALDNTTIQKELKKPVNNNTQKTSAKQKNNTTKKQAYRINIVGYTTSIPTSVLNIIKENTQKDIAKHSENGVLTYTIGLFSNQDTANQIADKIKEATNSNTENNYKITVTVEKIN